MPTPSQETIDTLEAGLSDMTLTPPISPARSSTQDYASVHRYDTDASNATSATSTTLLTPTCVVPASTSGIGVSSGVGMPFNMNKHELTPVIRNTSKSYLNGIPSSVPVLRPRNNTVDDCMEALRPVSPCWYKGEVTLPSSSSSQPSRDDSFSSFGLVPDDTVDAIFLPSKSGNEKRRSSFHSLDDTDASVETTLSHHSQYSHYSIPSIRLAGRVRCNTQEDSFATIEPDDDDGSLSTDEGDDSATIPSIGEDGCIEKRKRRCLSSRDKKEVFEWLRTVESRSQDQFAEAL